MSKLVRAIRHNPTLRRWYRPLFAAVRGHIDGHSDVLAASLAFFTVLSLAPLLVLAIAVVGTVFGSDATRLRLFADLTTAIGPQAAGAIDQIVQHAVRDEDRWWRVAFGILVTVWGSTRIFVRVQEALNAVWGVRATKEGGWRNWLRRLLRKRALSFLLVMAVGALLFGSMIAESVISVVMSAAQTLPHGVWTSRLVRASASILAITLLLLPVYRVLPDVEIGFRDVWRGALLAAVVTTIGARAMGSYFSSAAASSPGGAAGGVLVLLLWINLVSHVMLFGARFTREWVRENEGAIVPEPHAEIVDQPLAAAA